MELRDAIEGRQGVANYPVLVNGALLLVGGQAMGHRRLQPFSMPRNNVIPTVEKLEVIHAAFGTPQLFSDALGW